MTDPDQLLHFNGVDATTGGPLFPMRDAASFATRLLMQASSGIDAEHLRELQGRDTLSIKDGVDITDLAQTGWGVVFPAARPGTPEARRQDAIAEALYPLFDLRRSQAARIDERRFKIYRGADGYRPNETKSSYLQRLGATPGDIDPDQVPYYLMIVASPEELPFNLQVQLDVHYSVGRLHFDTVEPYAHYARTVLAAENGPLRPRSIALVGVTNPGDPVSFAAARDLVTPLATPLATAAAPDWQVFHYANEHAQKASVIRLLGGDATPAVLMLAGHGLGFPGPDPLQRRYQGAFVCQDWPGPGQPGRLHVPSHCISADDLRPDADVAGLILIDLTCFGAGTPTLADDGRALTDAPFTSALHQGLLGHPRGTALATIGHVERAYGAAAHGDEARGHRMALDTAIRKLLAGYPVGAAMEEMNDRYATLALDLHARLTALKSGQSIEPHELADLWISTHDARGCAISGDPAVRVAAPPIRRVDPPARPRTVIRTLIQVEEPALEQPALDDPPANEPGLDDPQLDDPQLDDPQLDEPQFDDQQFDSPPLDDPQFDAPPLDEPQLDDPPLDDQQFDEPQLDDQQFDAPQLDDQQFDEPQLEAPALEAPALEAPAQDDPAQDADSTDIDIDEDDTPEPPPIAAPVSRTLIDVPREQALAESAAPVANPARQSGPSSAARTTSPATAIRISGITPTAAPRPAKAVTRLTDLKPAETRPIDLKPAETRPAETRPIDTRPPESKPIDIRPTDQPRQVTHTVTSKPAADEPSFASFLHMFTGKTTAAGQPELPSLEQLAHGLLQLARRSLADLGDVEVRTFVTRDITTAAAADPGALAQSAELRAFSRLHQGGAIDVIVPEGAGEADREVWQMHGEMVKQAQVSRAELLRVLLTTSAHILRGG